MLETLKSMADPCRLRLIAILSAGEFTVQELTRILDMGQSRISRHLKILADAGVVTVKRQGSWSYYRVGEGNPFFCTILPALDSNMDALACRSADRSAVARVLEERRRRSQEFFNRHARQWDDLAKTLLPVPDYLGWLMELIPANKTLLEIGVGTGGLLPELASRSSHVIGVDHSLAMLEEARRRVSADGLTAVELRLGEMHHLPLSDDAVDCVVAKMVLHHAADPVAVLHEIQRVLTAEGVLILADLVRHEKEWAREQLADQWLGFEEQELTGWLKSAGFGCVECIPISGGVGQVEVLLVKATKLTTDSRAKAFPETLCERNHAVSLPKRGRVGVGEPSQEKKLFIPQQVPTPLLEAARRLRSHMTDTELLLWRCLRKKQLAGYRFRRQHPFERYVLDFYCSEAKLAVELDGGQHNDSKARVRDAERTCFCEKHGIQIIRFWNNEILSNIDGVLEKIYQTAQERCPLPSPPPPGEGAG